MSFGNADWVETHAVLPASIKTPMTDKKKADSWNGTSNHQSLASEACDRTHHAGIQQRQPNIIESTNSIENSRPPILRQFCSFSPSRNAPRIDRIRSSSASSFERHIETKSNATAKWPGEDVYGNNIAEKSHSLVLNTSQMLPLFARQTVKLCILDCATTSEELRILRWRRPADAIAALNSV